MSTHKHIDKICYVVLAFTLIIALLFMNAEKFGIQKEVTVMGYESTLFDTSRVHTIDIVMDDWDEFTENCKSEEYYSCTVVIDNEAYKNVAIRGKGNTSLSQVSNDRYSYKIEFDHYDSTNTYYGLDKLCLNNIIQDNTYMKDYLTYQMMNEIGVASPLCSYAYITVNGEDWGLYLAVEGVEEAFLQRNYGNDYGELYKPDSMSMGGGRGNGEGFDIDAFLENAESESTDSTQSGNGNGNNTLPQMPDKITNGGNGNQMSGGMTPPDNSTVTDGSFTDIDSQMQQGGTFPEIDGQMPDVNMQGNKGGMTNGSDDVLLKYIDDEIESYSNIFDNAKTDITDNDKTRLIKSLKTLSEGENIESAVDIDSVIRYFVVHNFVLNFDSYTGSMIHNYYLYENDGIMQMIPWDYNLAFGGFQSMGNATSLVNYPIDSPVSDGNVEDRPMLAWIFATEDYTELYHTYFAEFISEYFDSGYFSEMIDDINEMISPYVEKDPTKFCTYEEFKTGIETLKEFCLLRAESISGQLNGSVGSTSDTQKNDTLIDAGDIQISDMGSMNNTMGGTADKPDGDMGGNTDGNMQNPWKSTDNDGFSRFPTPDGSVENFDFSGGMRIDNSNIQHSNADDESNTPPEVPNGENGNVQNNTPPELPDGENGNEESDAVPEAPNGENKGFGQNDFADGNTQKGSGENMPNSMEKPTSQAPSSMSSSSVILLFVSVVVLIGGILFAFLFKRRKQKY